MHQAFFQLCICGNKGKDMHINFLSLRYFSLKPMLVQAGYWLFSVLWVTALSTTFSTVTSVQKTENTPADGPHQNCLSGLRRKPLWTDNTIKQNCVIYKLGPCFHVWTQERILNEKFKNNVNNVTVLSQDFKQRLLRLLIFSACMCNCKATVC